MTIQEAYQRLLFQLYGIYDNREAANISDIVMENITGWKKIDRILNKQVPLVPAALQLLEKYTIELLSHKPVQYVLNEAWFYGLKFFVNEHVLIPRPETEELVEWIVKDASYYEAGDKSAGKNSPTILDIGTGSGCIPVTLKKQLPGITMFACDISKDALEVCQKNAMIHQTDIGLLQLNFLDASQWDPIPSLDIIVSNPPYIPLAESKAMRPNVVQYEPHLALFVEDTDPMIFYRSIAEFAIEKMNPGGTIYAELHEELAPDVSNIFLKNGFANVEIKKDMQAKDRMIRVKR